MLLGAGFHSVKGSGEQIKGKHKAIGAILQLFGGDTDTLDQLCFFRLYTISLGVDFRNKKARANRTAVAALLAREALPYFQSGALQRAAALAIFRGLCRCVNEYVRANPSKLS